MRHWIMFLLCLQYLYYMLIWWTNLHTVNDQKLTIETPNMCCLYKKKPVQMIYEYGIFSTCFIGKELPDWLGGNKSSNGSSISFMMPSTPANKRFKGFNIASVHAFIGNTEIFSFLSTVIVNKTKNLTWEYDGNFSVLGENVNSEMVVRLSHWMFGENEFEDGDEVTVQIVECLSDVTVKECLISPVYGDHGSVMDDDEDEDDPLSYYKSWKYRIGGDVSPFQTAQPGYYYVNDYQLIDNKMKKGEMLY